MWLLCGSAQTFAVQAVQVGLYLVFAVLCGRFLGPEGKGVVDMCLVTGALASLVFGLSIPSGVTYTVSKGGIDIRRLRRVLILICTAQVFLAVCVLQFIGWLRPNWRLLPNNLGVWPIYIVAGFIGSDLLRSNLRAILVGQLRILRANLNDLLKQAGLLATIAVVYAIHRTNPLSMEWKVKLVLIGLNLSSIPALVSAYQSTKDEQVGGGLRLAEMLRVCLPSGAANILQGINYRAPAIVVASIFGAAAVGVYQVAFSIAQMLSLVPGAVAALLVPSVARQEPGSRETADRTTLVCILAVIAQAVLAFAAYFVASVAIPLLLGPAFGGAVVVLAFLLPGAVVFAATTVLAGHVAGRRRPEYCFWASAVGCVVVWTAAKYLPVAYGLRGAAAASSLSAIANTLTMVILYVRMERIEPRALALLLKKSWHHVSSGKEKGIQAWQFH